MSIEAQTLEALAILEDSRETINTESSPASRSGLGSHRAEPLAVDEREYDAESCQPEYEQPSPERSHETVELLARGGPVKIAGGISATQGKVTGIFTQGAFDPTESEPVFNQEEPGYLVATLHLAYSNKFEIATRAQTERRRVLEKLAPFLIEEQSVELQDLRGNVSSVSTVSVSGQQPSSSPTTPQGICGDECWLKTDAPLSEPVVDGHYEIPLFADPFFKYTPIRRGQTRIIRLQPGSTDQPITITIILMNQNDVGPYDALSYTWGPPTQSKRIIVMNEKLTTVVDSLYNALMYLRLPDKQRWLWIDALCINQDDNTEKALQIPMMTSIYRNAQKVIVWLGEHGNNSELAIAGMKHLEIEENRKQILHPAHDEACMKQLNKLYEAFLAIYRRSYFRRTWIRQEITVAKRVEVQCGRDTVSWYALKRTARRLKVLRHKIKTGSLIEPAEMNSDSFCNLQYLSRGWRYGKSAFGFMAEAQSVYYYHGGGLLELLMISREFDATDARDKVYGVLGLAREPIDGDSVAAVVDHDRPQFVVDYSQSVSEVYQHLAKYFINRDRNLDILCILSTHRGPNSSDLPTWTPDWRVSTSYIGLTECWDYIGMKHSTAIAAQAEPQDQDGGGKLVVRAFLLDRIETLLEVTGDVCNAINIAIFGSEDTEKHEAETKPYDSRKHSRRFCLSAAGEHVLVPAGAEEYDFIVLLCGARLPFIIRPRTPDPCETAGEVTFLKEGAQFEMVGPCYHQYLMDGRIFERIQQNYPPLPRVVII